MSNLTPKMNQTSIEINGNLHFSQIWDGESFETLQTVSNVKMNIFQIKIFNEITLLLFIIYSFVKFIVLVSLPKSFNGPLGLDNVLHLANWPCNWSQFNWVKQTANTASVQWGFTVYIILGNTFGFDDFTSDMLWWF